MTEADYKELYRNHERELTLTGVTYVPLKSERIWKAFEEQGCRVEPFTCANNGYEYVVVDSYGAELRPNL